MESILSGCLEPEATPPLSEPLVWASTFLLFRVRVRFISKLLLSFLLIYWKRVFSGSNHRTRAYLVYRLSYAVLLMHVCVGHCDTQLLVYFVIKSLMISSSHFGTVLMSSCSWLWNTLVSAFFLTGEGMQVNDSYVHRASLTKGPGMRAGRQSSFKKKVWLITNRVGAI